MTMGDSPSSDVLAKYKALISGFIHHDTSASDFESGYLKMFKEETEIFGQDVFDILEDLFTSADGYVADPELRKELLASNPDLRKYGQGLDDEELRAAAREAYRQLFGE
jgi:Bacterial self-protective colicin-like immunity